MSLPRRWQASWIWPRDYRQPNLHLLFRKDFELDAVPETGILHIAAESSAQVVLNGGLIGRTSANSYPHQHYYESFPCRGALVAGTNRLAVVVRYIGIPSSSSIPKDPGLLAELELGGGGTVVSIGSDADWRCLVLPAWLGRQRRSEWLNLDHVEVVDHRLLPEGFPYPQAGQDFLVPEALRWPGVRFTGLEPRPFAKAAPEGEAPLRLLRAGTVADRSAEFAIPAVAVSEETLAEVPFQWDGVSPFLIPAQPAGRAFCMQLALGNYLSGRPEIAIEAPAGAVLDLAWEEKLTDGRFDVRTTRVYTADRHILPFGLTTIVPGDWLTGRFLQLTFRNIPGGCRVPSLRFIAEAYPLRQRLYLSSSDPVLERIFEISLQAVRRCMHDNIMDCPWRERRQWIGDVQRIALVSHFAFGDRDLVRAVLRQHVGMQDPSGRMWCCVPIWEEYPTQSMEWVRAVIDYSDFTGDESLLHEVMPNIGLLHGWFLRQRDQRGLLFIDQPPVMNWMDNPFSRLRAWQFEAPFLVQNLRYLLFLDDMAACLERTGRPAECAPVRDQRRLLAERIRLHFFDPQSGLLRDCPAGTSAPATCSWLGHALAVCAGLLPPGQAAPLWDRFTAFAASRPDEVIPCSPFGQYHVHQALAVLQRPDAIVADILAKWGPMVAAGADTTWEDFAGRASHCHGWAAIPVVSLAGMVLGLDPRLPGKARRTNIGGVHWLEAFIEPPMT